MRRILILLLCALLLFALAGCSVLPVSGTSSMPNEIPANASVNTAWGGYMCEANGFVYYVSDADGQDKIMRMQPDGSNPTAVTADTYDYISNLTSDSASLYFAASGGADELDTIYRLPLSGESEQKVAQGHVYALQNANGKLFWEDNYVPSGAVPDTTPYQINCVNSDGSDPQTLLTFQADPVGFPFEFLVGGNSIYYTTGTLNTGDYSYYSDLYRMDLNGKNAVKLNTGKLNSVDMLFYDQGTLYFLVEPPDDSSIDDPFFESLETMDTKGNAVTLVKHVGYFPQDFSDIEYCGISNNIFYYFVLPSTDGSSAHLYMDLHQVDLSTKRDTILLRHVEMGDPAVGILASVRGKSIKNDGVDGLYIVGNDIYFSPYSLP